MQVFQVNDCEWYMAESPAQARFLAVELLGDDDCIYPIGDIQEVSAEDMQRLEFHNTEDGTSCTFQEELDRRLATAGESDPSLFASTEY